MEKCLRGEEEKSKQRTVMQMQRLNPQPPPPLISTTNTHALSPYPAILTTPPEIFGPLCAGSHLSGEPVYLLVCLTRGEAGVWGRGCIQGWGWGWDI